ncbi:MAG: hypothetical protein HKO68_02835 [Desulfobacterales bacterium]|nr:hypothetical protein [Deltaproteobacteria bacterium]NNL75255.1 hypothetical protein [Desulfobacterales bacterium]
MKILRLLSKFMVFGIMVAVVFVVAPSVCLGNGAGPEPGENCPTGEQLKYLAPPFIGDVTLYLIDTGKEFTIPPIEPIYNVGLVGTLYKVGDPECKIDVAIEPFWLNVRESKFKLLKPKDLRQICIDAFLLEFDGCEEIYTSIDFAEVIGVGHLKYDAVLLSTTAQFVLMPIE